MKVPTRKELRILLNNIHHNINHGGFKEMIDKIKNEKIYMKGLTAFIYNTINNCPQCNQKNNNNYKRINNKPIILNYSKKSYLGDITYSNSIFREDYEYPYLLVIQDHFSKL